MSLLLDAPLEVSASAGGLASHPHRQPGSTEAAQRASTWGWARIRR